MSNKTEEILTKSISRRTAIKAAAAAGAALYAAPAIDTLVAHAQTVTKFGSTNVFIQTCGGAAGYNDGGGSASITIAPASGCVGNSVMINGSTYTNQGTATASTETGTTNNEVEKVQMSFGGGSCTITITNVVDTCTATPSAPQKIAIHCTDANGNAVYDVNLTPITSGKVALATCHV